MKYRIFLNDTCNIVNQIFCTLCWKVCTGKSFTRDLTEDLVAEILSRIPIKTISRWKCVCKRWHKILSEPYFANLHLSRLPAGLITSRHNTKEYAIFSLAELDDKPGHHGIHHEPLMSFDPLLSDYGHWKLCGSVNGLICLWRYHYACICNPITREYIVLSNPEYIKTTPTYGFGLVKSSNEYKVVCFYEEFTSKKHLAKSLCEVYTLGTGKWRNLGQVSFLVNCGSHGRQFVSGNLYWFGSTDGIFVRGNLHWLVYDQKATNHERVCTFDLEKEVFQLSASPQPGDNVGYRTLGMLGECLCICDSMLGSEYVIWVMKDYGKKESWSKEIVIQHDSPSMKHLLIHPIKVFKDGSILLLTYWSLFTYDPANNTIQDHKIFGPENFFSHPISKFYVPSSISLKSFMLEKVSVF